MKYPLILKKDIDKIGEMEKALLNCRIEMRYPKLNEVDYNIDQYTGF